jgi:hypothetical protein
MDRCQAGKKPVHTCAPAHRAQRERQVALQLGEVGHARRKPLRRQRDPAPACIPGVNHNVFVEKAEVMRTSQASFTASLLLLAGACARSPAPAATPSPLASASADSARTSRAIQVQVDNQNFSDMNVYLVTRGSRWLVGNVPGLTKTTLTVPAGVAPADLRVRLRAQAIGGAGGTTTPTLIVAPGQQVYWTIGSDPAMSTASAG